MEVKELIKIGANQKHSDGNMLNIFANNTI
jgi:hypothetical protein